MGHLVGFFEPGFHRWRVGRRKERSGAEPTANALSVKHRDVDDMLSVYVTGIHRAIDDWPVYLVVPDTGSRSLGANYPAKSDSPRTSGTRVRFCPKRRASGIADHGLP